MLASVARVAVGVLAVVVAASPGYLAAENPASTTAASKVDFNRDIRPILSDACFQCHGPDGAQRKAELRLDDEKDVLRDRDGHRVIVAGDLANSTLIERIFSTDANERMPPPDSGKSLTPKQAELIRQWVAQGAKWQPHWSLIPPVRPATPTVSRADWVRNPIDAHILARLEREGLAPTAAADKLTWLRRVSLDLTGLPPSLEEADAFLADDSVTAHETVVDRLLASPRFGERMAARWLDGARYADTNGYQSDGERSMWRWRDWVIDAFNHNMPFDLFTIEQIAGDLLPNPTLEQRIATGFNRNHRGNAEGGIIPEEYAVEYVVDRVEATSTVWLGLTMGCVRCHDHKFDPLTQRDFYRMFAYFNNVPERGRAIKFGNSPPIMSAPTAAQQQELKRLDQALVSAEQTLRTLEPEIDAAQAEWERAPGTVMAPTVPSLPFAQFDFDQNLQNRGPTGAPAPVTLPLAPGTAPAKYVAEPKVDGGSAVWNEGQLATAIDLHGKEFVDAGDLGNFSYLDKFSVSLWANPRTPSGVLISRMAEKPEPDGWSLELVQGRLHVNLIKRWLDDSIQVRTDAVLPINAWRHLLVTYDGTRMASGIQIFVDGIPQKLTVILDALNQEIQTTEPLRIGGGGGVGKRFDGMIDETRLYQRVLTHDEALVLAVPEALGEILAIPADRRTRGQTLAVRTAFLEAFAPPALREARRRIVDLQRQRERFVDSLPTVMVMVEMPEPRTTHVLLRGEYDKPGETVTAGVPAVLHTLPEGVPNNRLGLAKWLVDRRNPLMARVIVNRYWQQFFGAGLVRTLEDFGSQGDPPSHPELLDWLALEFMDSGWNVKGLLRQVVLSSTYRQSSRVTPALQQKDPENRLLARGPRFRLSAEAIRDQALFASGLLVENVGGPSVLPYQPEGLWLDLATLTDYPQSHGGELYRRSMYTYWKRTVAPPTMMTFDAAARETCTVRETRTNTPLQALTLLNEITFVEAARALAERVLLEPGTDAARLSRAFRLAVGRPPVERELLILTAALARQRVRFAADQASAEKFLSVGEHPRPKDLPLSELAAHAAVASMLLNLDEVVTRQ